MTSITKRKLFILKGQVNWYKNHYKRLIKEFVQRVKRDLAWRAWYFKKYN